MIYIFFWCGFRINLTKSLPVGIYKLSAEKPKKKDRVFFCLASNHPYLAVASQRGYLGTGSCPAGVKPLLKRLEGVSGDILEVSGAGIWVNGEFLVQSAWRPTDSRGRPMMKPWNLLWGEPVQIRSGQALVMSEGADLGFDSRYFGLIDEQSLTKVMEIITF
jgi:conjugative transfer signal peptidase TraF